MSHVEVVTVAVDGSDHSAQALEWAVGEAAARGALLRAVTVWNVFPPAGFGDIPYPWTDQQLEAGAGEMLDKLLSDVGVPAGVEVERVVRSGVAADEITDAADGSRMLVLGARGLGGFPGLRVGSVSLRCAHLARQPVVVVRRPPEPTRGRIVVGLDGSDASLAALRFAVEEARVHGLAVTVLNAVHWPSIGTELMRPTVGELEAWGERLLRDSVHDVTGGQADVAITQRVVVGHPAQVLDDAGRDAALLVVGTTGRVGLVSLLLGSVAAHLLRHARVSVAVVPPPA